VVQQLKNEAKQMLSKDFYDIDVSVSELKKYELWDMLDNLQDMFESGREDFDFIYYVSLDKLISTYMRSIRYPYSIKLIMGNIVSEVIRNKYLLKKIPDVKISELILQCITTSEKRLKMECYEQLTKNIFDIFGGFDVSKYLVRSQIDI